MVIYLFESFDLVFECFLTFILYFLSLFGKDLCCSPYTSVFMLNQIDSGKCASSDSFDRFIELIESFMTVSSTQFIIYVLNLLLFALFACDSGWIIPMVDSNRGNFLIAKIRKYHALFLKFVYILAVLDIHKLHAKIGIHAHLCTSRVTLHSERTWREQ